MKRDIAEITQYYHYKRNPLKQLLHFNDATNLRLTKSITGDAKNTPFNF